MLCYNLADLYLLQARVHNCPLVVSSSNSVYILIFQCSRRNHTRQYNYIFLSRTRIKWPGSRRHTLRGVIHFFNSTSYGWMHLRRLCCVILICVYCVWIVYCIYRRVKVIYGTSDLPSWLILNAFLNIIFKPLRLGDFHIFIHSFDQFSIA